MITAGVPSHCVIVPFYNRVSLVARCLSLLLADAMPATRILLVDDGSDQPADLDPELAALCADARVTMLRHETNRGVAAARNTAIRWCRQAGIEIVLMMDSDCEPPLGFIGEHIRLHAEHPEAACIGAAIVGFGDGFWARLDNVMTWVHAMPFGAERYIEHPYHLVTTNFSVRLDRLPARDEVFDGRLRTGEDALLVRELRRQGERVLFSPRPVVRHRDRDSWRGVLKHHYEYGHHQYFIQLGNDVSARCFNPMYRALFVVAFAGMLPFFALLCSALNLKPWLLRRPQYIGYYPLMYVLWLAKGVAILEAAVAPSRALRALPNAGMTALSTGAAVVYQAQDAADESEAGARFSG